jgi:hypothetical protein
MIGWRLTLLVIATSGCDVLFQIVPLQAEVMSAPDGAATCTDSHDEDHDGVGDACDNCPTVANPDQANHGELDAGNPADAVGDACDPRPTDSGDIVALFYPFDGGAVGARTIGAVAFDPDDVTIIGEFSALITGPEYTPTRVVAEVALASTSTMQEVQLSANTGGFRCDVTTAPCPTAATDGCLSAYIAPIAQVPLAAPTQLMEIEMYVQDPSHLGCTATTAIATATAVDSASFQPGQVALYTQSAFTQATVSSLVVYAIAK